MYSPRLAYLEYATTYSKPFIAYRMPNSKQHTTLILSPSSCQQINNLSKISTDSAFVFTPFNTEKNMSLLITPEEILTDDKGFRGDLFLDKKTKKTPYFLSENEESKESYKTQFEQLHQLLQKNHLKKAILSKTITIKDFASEEQVYVYHNLCESYPKAMVYWVHLPELGVEWMGASPEILLYQNGEDLETIALAGTKKAEEEWTAKEKEEQQMVVDYIAKELNQFHPRISPTETLDTGSVQHLATHFLIPKGVMHFAELANRLHPTPAICGLPKEKAYKAILATEKHDRGYYSGLLGPINIQNTTALFVNLRCMQLSHNAIRLYVGGGLTKHSTLKREWQETERKADTLRNFLI